MTSPSAHADSTTSVARTLLRTHAERRGTLTLAHGPLIAQSHPPLGRSKAILQRLLYPCIRNRNTRYAIIRVPFFAHVIRLACNSSHTISRIASFFFVGLA